MTNEKMVPESEAVKREREAYVAGAESQWGGIPSHQTSSWREEAKRRYPLTVTRPRVVEDTTGWYWRVSSDASIETTSTKDGAWRQLVRMDQRLTKERVLILADLLANPTEDVDADSQSEESQRSVPGQEADR